MKEGIIVDIANVTLILFLAFRVTVGLITVVSTSNCGVIYRFLKTG